MSKLVFKPLDQDNFRGMSGIQAKQFFPNGYGVSVIKHNCSYGNKSGLYELAVFTGEEHNSLLCYSTPITNGVIGHLTLDEAQEITDKVEKLPQFNKDEVDINEHDICSKIKE